MATNSHSLDGSGTRVDLGDGFAIVAPEVRGTVTSIPETPGIRSRAFGEESFDAQLESAGLSRTRIIELEATAPPAGTRAARGLGDASPEHGVLQVPRSEGESAIVLMEDEHGALRWLLPQETIGGARALAASPAVLTFAIPLSASPVAGARGIGGVFKKVFKIFKYPIEKLEEGIGNIVAGFIKRWERTNRPYLVCTYGPDSYRSTQHEAHAVSPSDWSRLASGRALLFVHGTFSSCDAFFSITPDVIAELSRRYEGRMFAFNHPTLADDPTQNAQQLLASMPPASRPMTLDIVCHSRGGMVAREIARLGAAAGLTVGRIVMVGVPNGGTPLADREHMVGMVDRLTTIAKFVPSRAATIIVDALVAAIKVIAHGLLDEMAGLKAMNPAEDFVKALNAAPSAGEELFAIVSNYEPPAGTPLFSLTRVTDVGADFAFGNAANDLVVPTEGGFAVAAPGFPVPQERRFEFATEAGVIHTEYFARGETQQRLLEWLQPSAARDLASVRARGLIPADLDSLRPHVINLSNGTFSRRGTFGTTQEDVDAIFTRHLPAWAASRPGGAATPLRIVVWAHGGLINEKDGLEIAFKHVAWWKANGVYPLYFVWETGLFDALGSLLSSAARGSRAIGARGFSDFSDHLVEGVCRRLRGDLIWGAMKTNAERCSATDGGAQYVAERLKEFCDANAGTELHACGHSAGSIFHAHFLPAAKKAGVPPFTSLQLLAPAIRVDTFKQRLLPLVGKSVRSLSMYSMSDDYEQRDTCLGVYRKSLLYLIHHALEDEDRVPVLGLQASASNDPDVRMLFWGTSTQAPRARAVWSVTRENLGDVASRSTTHGGFDDDAATMTSVGATILGEAGRAQLKPYVGDARRGREWPLSADVEIAIAPPVLVESAPQPVVSTMVHPLATIPEGRAGRRLGLCIGIDRYPGRDALFGCVADARAWKTLLEQKLQFDRVDTLTDDKATRMGIATAVKSLLMEAKAGDTVVLQYSGHGTSLPDDAGDEADGTDEALVPIDFGDGQFITDDDIRGFLLDELKDGVSLTVFMDCCHSGTITRMLGRTASAPLPGVRARFMRFERDDPAVRQHLAQRDQDRKMGTVRSFADRSVLRWVNFSACDATEKAFEQNGNGDFTRYATALLAGGVAMSNAEFQRRIVREFGASRRQTPQLDCPLEAEGLPLLQFTAGTQPPSQDATAHRRSGADRRSGPTVPTTYDRRTIADRRHSDTAEQLRGLAERIESWSQG